MFPLNHPLSFLAIHFILRKLLDSGHCVSDPSWTYPFEESDLSATGRLMMTRWSEALWHLSRMGLIS